ncbi:Fe-S protein assembly co-chaperone HscB [Edaphobacter sp. 12200R-103]|jgi:molecular chaperone HscB|uniref:Fe-S protein assembly co-chaperone HscB n=1 Tax=Edaphobacter sp. 12200R-103 TaxID=2703788 RepID=UPI00138BDF21|nr:Fe-S protein assembly co-chaperone HscB [Edaphobacter sp. 12200R-103]QHS53272.1 Fe-S protein assembly co-chaperone HscB [Edaphobacter sp. 12200R-103]
MNYFEVFGLPEKLRIDTSALEKQFYTLSRKLHPDRFASRPAEEQEEALRQSSLLNDAYRTLKDPVLRTQYLLKLEGVELEEQSKAATDAARQTGGEKKQAVPPELLEEVFELNMQLQEMRMAKQMGEDEPELRRDLMTAKDTFDARMIETQAELEGLWDQWDDAADANNDAAKETTRNAMVNLLNKRNYLRNLVRDVNEALE